jgi:RNA-directed DNA polymerase
MERVFTYKKLYQAYLDCRKNKRNTVNALKFEIDFESKLKFLLEELKNRTYVPGRSICFVVTTPKPREIFAADFQDRIIHHLLVREIEDYFEKKFIHDSYACRKGKGTHRAVSRLREFLRKKENRNAWYLKMDIKSFFMSINRDILYELAAKSVMKSKIRNEEESAELLWLMHNVIFHSPALNYTLRGKRELFSLIPDHKSLLKQKENKGLPIGNYSSQFFANVYLNELDQFIKRELKCRHYIRYVDDFILISPDKQKLLEWKNKISVFVSKKLDIAISEKKTAIQPVKKGIDWVGYFLKPDSVYSRRQVFKRYKDKLFRIAIGKRKTSLQYLQSMHNSYSGHFEFKGKFPARTRNRILTFTGRVKLPASISVAS